MKSECLRKCSPKKGYCWWQWLIDCVAWSSKWESSWEGVFSVVTDVSTTNPINMFTTQYVMNLFEKKLTASPLSSVAATA